MSGKRPSLAESMKAVAEAPAAAPSMPPTLAPAAKSIPAPVAPQGMGEGRKAFYAATRAGKKKATATLSSEAHRQLKLLGLDHGGVEALLTEAINDLFRKYGMPPIA